MDIVDEKDLREYSAIRIGGEAFHVFKIQNDDDIWKIHHLAQEERKPLIILGDGTNSIFKDNKDIIDIYKVI